MFYDHNLRCKYVIYDCNDHLYYKTTSLVNSAFVTIVNYDRKERCELKHNLMVVIYDRKIIYESDTCGQCYKTFYGRKL
jgi:hypothetical protein